LKEAIARIKKESELFQGEIQDFTTLMQIYRSAIKEVQTKLEILDDTFKTRYSHNPIHHIESRLKSPQSIVEKMRRKGVSLDIDTLKRELNDVAGIRVICKYVEDVYSIAEMLTSQSDVKLICTRDYIRNPKDNGYRSLHIVVEVPIFLANRVENVRCEVQLRTIAMDFWASLEHKLKYKTDSQIPEDIKIRLKECAEAIAYIDSEMEQIHKELS